jgi:hypothetical protein
LAFRHQRPGAVLVQFDRADEQKPDDSEARLWYGESMPTRPRKPLDFTQIALQVVEAATGGPLKPPQPVSHKNPAAVALGMLGASKGGKARAAKLSPARRKKIAKQAAQTRWKKHR